MAGRLTRQNVEVASTDNQADARLTRQNVEVASTDNQADVRLTRQNVEVASTDNQADVRVTQLMVEILGEHKYAIVGNGGINWGGAANYFFTSAAGDFTYIVDLGLEVATDGAIEINYATYNYNADSGAEPTLDLGGTYSLDLFYEAVAENEPTLDGNSDLYLTINYNVIANSEPTLSGLATVSLNLNYVSNPVTEPSLNSNANMTLNLFYTAANGIIITGDAIAILDVSQNIYDSSGGIIIGGSADVVLFVGVICNPDKEFTLPCKVKLLGEPILQGGIGNMCVRKLPYVDRNSFSKGRVTKRYPVDMGLRAGRRRVEPAIVPAITFPRNNYVDFEKKCLPK